jgi:hypothetical protein
MEELIKKIKALNNSLKDVRASIKPKGMPELGAEGFNMTPMSLETPKAPAPKGPQSKKDPVKVAEQIKDGNAKKEMVGQAKQNRSKLNINRSGQWSLK